MSTAQLKRFESSKALWSTENIIHQIKKQMDEKMEVSWERCSNRFTIYANQTVMLDTVNGYNDICQLFLNKTGEKTNKPKYFKYVKALLSLLNDNT